MASRVYEVFGRDSVTNEMLLRSAELFNENYGVWADVAPSPRKGRPITMTVNQLRANFLPCHDSWYARAFIGGVLVGHAFACQWFWEGRVILWVTQLVVKKEYRRRGIAKNLLRVLNDRNDAYGILSPNPAACLAMAAAFDCGPLENVSFDFIRENARHILTSSPIPYVRGARPCGCAFGEENGHADMVSCADTKFFVDHQESLDMVDSICLTRFWPLGRELPDGYEFLLIMLPGTDESDSSDD
ncbi:hypothetical protein ANO14919_081930 [Xylariales sp. No.14919]|nr:hypothetical protein F5X98DRAFT_376886 [Xylaria grammica]GAW18712.1 hypothetical protein ANO14919_081930 [Xylariales sp. No.14919]